MEELLIGVNTPIHLSEAGEELIEDVVEENVKTRRCQPLLPLGTSTCCTLIVNLGGDGFSSQSGL